MSLSGQRQSLRGFTLVELSIVLVIIGLLVGGVLSGQSLIRAAELRAITSEFQKFTAGVNTFRDKYMSLPGDMTNAGAFWPAIGNAAIDSASLSSVKGNGNGDGLIGSALAAGKAGEEFTFWEELSLAGITEGSFSGNAGGGGVDDSQSGINVPKSKVGNAVWAALSSGGGNTFTFEGPKANSFPGTSVLKPEEAWNIDTKLDDSNPVTGRVLGMGSAGAAGSTNCYTSTGSPIVYNLSDSSQNCGLQFIKAF